MHPEADIIFRYFPDLSEKQQGQFRELLPLYRFWNEKINVISRKDLDHLYLRHILHSLAIAKFTDLQPGAHILDLGTGGGLPGIPLAILFPDTLFTLIDGTGKKIGVVREIADRLELENVTALHVRAENWQGKADFVVSRAVAPLGRLMEWSRPLLLNEDRHGLPNGLICLKGGDLKEEIAEVAKRTFVEALPLSTWFEEDFFEEKYLVYAQRY